jgi:UDP-2,4-diacetamido-2,4,6-trideoxy-beta-L-altropyranose hydrolase
VHNIDKKNSINKIVNKTLLIRADASLHIGSGHLMRCLALAQGWKDSGGEVVFATACSNDNLLGRLYEEGFRVHKIENPYPHPQDWQTTRQILEEHKGAWLVIDGYHFDSSYQRLVKESGHPLLAIDDYGHTDHYYADIVLNQNLHAESLTYSCEPYTRLLLGTKYVLLRREFLKWRNWERGVPEIARKVLITLGGSDPKNITLKAMQALGKVDIDGLEAVVVVGGGNPHYESLKKAIQSSRVLICLKKDVKEMPGFMAWADVAISGGGTTCWELAFMRLPSLILAIADNQKLNVTMLKRSGIALTLDLEYKDALAKIGDLLQELLRNKEARMKISQKSRTIVDGFGATRVVNIIASNSAPLT